MVDLLAALVDRGCLHILFRVLANLDSWDLQVNIIITSWQPWKNRLNGLETKTKKQEVSSAKNVQMLVDMHEL